MTRKKLKNITFDEWIKECNKHRFCTMPDWECPFRFMCHGWSFPSDIKESDLEEYVELEEIEDE